MTSIADRVRIAAVEQRLDDLERLVAALSDRVPARPEGAAHRPQGRAAITDALAGWTMTPTELAAVTVKTPSATKMMLRRMVKAGEVVARGRGRYTMPAEKRTAAGPS